MHRKPFQLISGVPLIVRLSEKLAATGYPVFIAVPHRELEEYQAVLGPRELRPTVKVIAAPGDDDPLYRMVIAMETQKLERVVRVCHDKVFVDPAMIQRAVAVHEERDLGYLYSSSAPDGSGFEVISRRALIDAHVRFKRQEHISYAVHCVLPEQKKLNFDWSGYIQQRHRLLVDYPEDLRVLEIILSALPKATLQQALSFLDANPWVARLNQLPKVTLYTCALNAERWIQKAMGSVSMQKGFHDCEYLLVDDFSSDRTNYLMEKFARLYKNVRVIRNQKNLGLASASNVALTQARGRYIMRLDADDFFLRPTVLQELTTKLEQEKADVVYSANFFGKFGQTQGAQAHHIGGALFRTKAANHVKFTEGLRGYEGYDFFRRAEGLLKIAHYDRPCFFYRQREGSLTQGNPAERAQLKEAIDARVAQGN